MAAPENLGATASAALVSGVLDLLGIKDEPDPDLVRRYLKEAALTKE